MVEEKKKPDGEFTEPKPPESTEEQTVEQPKEQVQEPPKEEEKKPEDKPTDEKQADENGEGADEPPKQEEKPQEPPKLSAEDELKSENLRLKTQLEAMKIGFNADVLEDAVVLAENIVKRDGSGISAALQAVAKKYPDWKADGKNGKSKGGFRVGADSSGGKMATSDEKLRQAFGIKKKN